MQGKKYVFLVLVLCLFITGCRSESGNGQSEDRHKETEIYISAAASMTDVMEELKSIYQEEHPSVTLIFNFASSGKLAQQIQQGAPVDVFISANGNWMDTLMKDNYVDTQDLVDVTENQLVLIAEKSSTLPYTSFDNIKKEDFSQIAIGNPETVPAGHYTKIALHNIGIWDQLTDQIVFAKDVRQVLTYVETGNTELGFVYKSDALISEKVNILAYPDDALQEEITYPGAVLKDAPHQEEAASFLTFLQSEQAQAIFTDYGFK